MADTHPDLSALLEHAGWVSALARTLAADSGTAEDLVQETWLVALRRQREPQDRAWLGGVLRNVARRWRRGRMRTARRERDAARAEATASTDQLCEQAELQRKLIGMVMELAEPYRSTVLLRYFEGLSLVELGRRRGIPESTARTHLARALERLRERFDREFQGKRGEWSALLARMPLMLGDGMAAPIVEGVVMGVKAKLALTVAAAVTVYVVLKPLVGGSHDELGMPAAAAEPLPVEREDASPTRAAESAGARVAVDAEASSAATSDIGVLVYGSVLGTDGARVAAGDLRFEGPDGEFTYSELGSLGSYSLIGLRPGTWHTRLVCAGYYPTTETIEVPHGTSRVRHDFVLAPSITLNVKFVTPQGETLDEVLGTELLFHEAYPVAVATLNLPPADLPGISGRDAAQHGIGRYRRRDGRDQLPGVPPDVTGLLELRHPPPVYVSAVVRNHVVRTVSYSGRVEDGIELTFVLSREEVEAVLGSARLSVVDAHSGLPLTTASAALSHTQGGGHTRPIIGPDGSIAFQRCLPGLLELEVGAAGYAGLKQTVRIRPGSLNELGTFQLTRSTTVRGRTLDPEGQPISVQMVVIPLDRVQSPADVEQVRSYHSDAEGNFVIDRLGRGSSFLLVDGEWARAPVLVDARSDLVEGVEIRMQRGTSVTFRSRAAPTADRLTIADSAGRPFWTSRVSADSAVQVDLVPGAYQAWLSLDEGIFERNELTVGEEPLRIELPDGGTQR